MRELYLLLVRYGKDLHEFVWPDVQSIADYFGIDMALAEPIDNLAPRFFLVWLPDEYAARQIGSRAAALSCVIRLWAHGTSIASLQDALRQDPELWQPFVESSTWRITLDTAYHHFDYDDKQRILNSFGFLDFRADIDLNQPDLDMSVFLLASPDDHSIRRAFAGQVICQGQRHLIAQYDVKQRLYIGNTTMQSEVSLYMSNQALAGPGKILYDPFMGTGSSVYTSAHYGASVLGSDIDGRHMRGKTNVGIRQCAFEYGLSDIAVLDLAVFDINLHPWRTGELFDAIITDPPYGVRAGARKLGRKGELSQEPRLMPNGVYSHLQDDYRPPSVGWEMSEVLQELLSVSLYLLKPGGRLVYFLPTEDAAYKDSDVPQLAGLKLLHNSSQNFGKWSRRLITMEKTTTVTSGAAARKTASDAGHVRFRERYLTPAVHRA
ncbi:uncharacterized protein L969DRAFT_89817 [Mixia osmundae IAM 14324]|uniref:Uncharacterized protein n=1 Tax=Mixia osmundae (strain CBS 9802 / IAM 14324 / JCM 22182 / KY 12970) TaxID=764103 RepID=G7DUZ1_MIXOS|nr:uncharacterized protein L969DRAFT_89817 [Mixia osmundae IAM 14324]KEI37267.1 hypothetical protein L969DRAFT_89817 [Mixia osmundae IAM 14324]GAA94401.1 hypothetical protein E5Q_01053 [Mixia osmundae IAM 14324]